jgi:hypothetical protein
VNFFHVNAANLSHDIAFQLLLFVTCLTMLVINFLIIAFEI